MVGTLDHGTEFIKFEVRFSLKGIIFILKNNLSNKKGIKYNPTMFDKSDDVVFNCLLLIRHK